MQLKEKLQENKYFEIN